MEPDFMQEKNSVGSTLKIANSQFLLFGPSPHEVFGKRPRLDVLAERDYQFAHEAPVYLPESNEVRHLSYPNRTSLPPE
jgi:hypothetical protein